MFESSRPSAARCTRDLAAAAKLAKVYELKPVAAE
jgi:hypothetical protein